MNSKSPEKISNKAAIWDLVYSSSINYNEKNVYVNKNNGYVCVRYQETASSFGFKQCKNNRTHP